MGITVSATQDSGQGPVIHGGGQHGAGHRVSVWETSPFNESLDACPMRGRGERNRRTGIGVRQTETKNKEESRKVRGRGSDKKRRMPRKSC